MTTDKLNIDELDEILLPFRNLRYSQAVSDCHNAPIKLDGNYTWHCGKCGRPAPTSENWHVATTDPAIEKAKAALHSMLIEAENRGGVRELQNLPAYKYGNWGAMSNEWIDSRVKALTNKQEGEHERL